LDGETRFMVFWCGVAAVLYWSAGRDDGVYARYLELGFERRYAGRWGIGEQVRAQRMSVEGVEARDDMR